jgi:hypothetical protein
MKKHKTLYDICKIETTHFRAVGAPLLKTYMATIKPPPKSALYNFIHNLQAEKTWREAMEHTDSATTRIKFAVKAAKAHDKSREYEHKIWDEQVVAGCRIASREQVARDAAREGKLITAERIRAQRELARRKRRRR